MKRILYFIGITFLICSCTKNKHLTDFWDTPYSSLDDAEQRLVELYDSILDEIDAPYIGGKNELIDLVVNDPATIDFPFQELQDHGHVTIATSEDGCLRCYSWVDDMGGEMTDYYDIVQYWSDDEILTFTGSKDRLFSCWGVKDIYTIYTDSLPIYLLYTHTHKPGYPDQAVIFAVKIVNGRIIPVNIFPDQEDKTSIDVEYTIDDWYSGLYDEPKDWYFRFDSEMETLYIPIADPHRTDQYNIYRYDGHQMRIIDLSGGFWLHPSLLSFKNLCFTYKTEDYLVRVDHLYDDTFRYAAWKADQEMDEEPQLVIKGGEVIADADTVDEDRTYSFKNNGYTYIVSNRELSVISPQGKTLLHQSKISPSID